MFDNPKYTHNSIFYVQIYQSYKPLTVCNPLKVSTNMMSYNQIDHNYYDVLRAKGHI